MDWTAEAIDQLRSLWAEGHSTAEIGRRMGISKNAVVGAVPVFAVQTRAGSSRCSLRQVPPGDGARKRSRTSVGVIPSHVP